MKAQDIMIEFNRLAENVYKLYSISDRLDPWNIEGIINKAQDQMIYERYLSYPTGYENVLALNQGYDEISELVKVKTGPAFSNAESGYGSNAKKIDELPDDYLYYVRSSCKVTRKHIEQVVDEWVETDIIGLKSLLGTITGGGNHPILINPLVYLAENNIYILHDGFTTISDINMMYLKQPAELDLNTNNECDLPLQWQYKLADYAVQLYLAGRKFDIKKEQEEKDERS